MKHIINNKLSMILVAISLLATTTFASNISGNSDIDGDLIEVAMEAGSFSTLAAALTEADLVETLQSEGPFTVFAPTDAAFAKLPEGTIENLLNDKEALRNILKYHVVSGNFTANDVVKYSTAKTLSNTEFTIMTKNDKVYINDSEVIKTDIKASNGVIHVIDTVLVPENN